MVALHFHPREGSPYWLRRRQEGGLPDPDSITEVADLAAFGPFNLDDLTRYPVEDFLPRAVRAGASLVLAETGGTRGIPGTVAYTRETFEAAFVTPFLDALGPRRFSGGHWLWLGPGGPHIIGKAAQRIASLTTASDAFSVDFDPRWFRRLTPGSVARERYLGHVLEQARRVLDQQDIRYLFSTPVVLAALGASLPAPRRERIEFIYLGGMPVRGETLAGLGRDFPRAEFLAGYGNTLFGVIHERQPGPANAAPRVYIPLGERLVAQVVQPDPDLAFSLRTRVAPGERGRVMLHRFDDSAFLPCVLERDGAERVECSAIQDGLRDPDALDPARFTPDSGIY